MADIFLNVSVGETGRVSVVDQHGGNLRGVFSVHVDAEADGLQYMTIRLACMDVSGKMIRGKP